MGQFKQMPCAGSFRVNPFSTLSEMLRNHRRRSRNIAELENLSPYFLEDIGLFEYTRKQIVLSR